MQACEACGKPLSSRQVAEAHRHGGEARFCSVPCCNTFLHEQAFPLHDPPKTCETCGASFLRPRKEGRQDFAHRRFCSRACDTASGVRHGKQPAYVREITAARWQELYWGPDSGYPSMESLARTLDCDRKTVRLMLKQHGLRVRTLSEQRQIECRLRSPMPKVDPAAVAAANWARPEYRAKALERLRAMQPRAVAAAAKARKESRDA